MNKQLQSGSIGTWALDNAKLVYFLIFALIVGGAKSFYDMSKLEDPEIKVKQALVVTTYPGASAHEVELEVTDVIEKNVRTMKDVEYVQSRSMNDVSMLTVNLSTLVKNEDVEQHWDILRRKVADVVGKLPEGAGTPVVIDDFGDVYGMFYALTADGYTEREISDYAGLIKRELQAIEGVTRVNLYGEQQECIEIELYEDRMANLGVMPVEALSTLREQNKTVYSGYYEVGDNRLRVSVSDRYRNVDDIGNLLIQGHEDDQLRLRDIAMIRKTIEKPVRNAMRYDRHRAVGIAIAALHGTDITKLGVQVEARLAELQRDRLPAGIEYHKVFFQPARVNEAIGTFMLNLAESLAIVVFLLMLTMGFRSGVIIGSSLVIVVIGSFLILNMFDGTLQRVSLAAFVLAMGMLVDNAIVIIDGILVDLKLGKERREALTAIGRKTGLPLLAATLIAVLAFFPIFLSPDTAGIYVRDLFIVLAVSLLLSWVLALTQVPIQANFMLKIKPQEDSSDIFNNKYYRALRKTLCWTLKHKTITIASAVFLLALSVWAYRFLPQGFFPDMDYDQLYIEYKLPEGTNSSKVSADLSEIEDYLLARKEITHVTTSIGGTPARYNLVRSIADPSLAYGELIVDFVSPKALVTNMKYIQADLSAAYPEAYVRLKRYNLMYKKYPIELQFNGPDPAVLRDLTSQAMEIMKRSPEVCLVNTDWEPKTPTLLVDYNQPVARTIGLTRQDVGISLLTATGGIPASSFHDGSHSQTIYLKCVDKNGRPVESIENSPVFSMMPSLDKFMDRQVLQGILSGAISEEEILESALGTVPLSQATQGVKVVWEDPVVVRYNGQRAMRAQGNPAFGVSTEEARQSIVDEIAKIRLPEGYSYQWEGEHSASSQAMKYLFANLPLSIILMLTILIMLFKDYRKPLIIFCCIPLIMMGVIIAMLLTGKTFGFVAIVGTLGLMGMMIKNGIVLMDEMATQINSGVEPVKALLDSASARFRPVMMASLTTIFGMLPLVTDDLFSSGSVAIMGGLLFGTLITLLIVPVLYAVFFGIKITSYMNKNASGKSKKIPALSVLLLLTAASSVAQEKYTLDACRELALKNNKEVAIAEQTEAKTLYESKSYFANFFPKFTASGAYLLSNSSFKKSIESAYLPTFTPDPATGQLTPNVMTMPDGSPVVGADGNPVFRQYAYFPGMDFNIRMNGAYFAGLQAEQPVFMGGKIISAYKMSKIGRDIAGLNRSLTRAEVIVKTDEAFWLHVKAMESKKVAEAFKKVIVELMQNVDAAVKVGMKTRNDLLKVQVQMNKADLQIQQAENAIRLSRMNLCQIMGMPLTSDILIDARFDNDDTTDPTTTLPASAYYTARPEFSILDKQIELKSQQVRLVRSDFLPNVGIGANYGYLHAIEFNGSPLIDKASFSALLTVRIPVFHWGEGLNKIRAAKAEKQIIELQRDDLSEKMELEMLRARDKLSESQLEVSLTARALEQAAENMRESGNHYNVGLETLADYLEAQTLWQQASLEALTAKINRRLNETYYLKAVGGL